MGGFGGVSPMGFTDIVVLSIFSQFLPKVPSRHRQRKFPSSLVRLIHLAPFVQVFGLFSQKVSSSSQSMPPKPGRQLHSHGRLQLPFTHPGYG